MWFYRDVVFFKLDVLEGVGVNDLATGGGAMILFFFGDGENGAGDEGPAPLRPQFPFPALRPVLFLVVSISELSPRSTQTSIYPL